MSYSYQNFLSGNLIYCRWWFLNCNHKHLNNKSWRFIKAFCQAVFYQALSSRVTHHSTFSFSFTLAHNLLTCDPWVDILSWSAPRNFCCSPLLLLRHQISALNLFFEFKSRWHISAFAFIPLILKDVRGSTKSLPSTVSVFFQGFFYLLCMDYCCKHR